MWTYSYSCPVNIRQIFSKLNPSYILTPPPFTHTHFHHETWLFLGPNPRSFFSNILSKQKPHVNVGNSKNQTSCILQLQLSRLFPLFSILFLPIILFKVSLSFFYLFLVFKARRAVTLPKCPPMVLARC